MNAGIHVEYSPINQAWLVCWFESVLRVFNTKREAKEYADSLVVEGRKCFPSNVK